MSTSQANQLELLARAIGTDIKGLQKALTTLFFDSWKAHNPLGTQDDFLAWVRNTKEVQKWVSEQLSNRMPSITFKTGTGNRNNLTYNAVTKQYTYVADPNYRMDYYWTQGDIEFTQDRNGAYYIIGRNETTGDLLAVCQINNLNRNGLIVKLAPTNGVFSTVMSEHNTLNMYVQPNSTIVPLHSRIKMHSKNDVFTFSYKAPNTEEWVELISLDKNAYPLLAPYTFGYHGFWSGVSGNERSGTNAKACITDPIGFNAFNASGGDTLITPMPNDKYAILAVIGQSNAVGYDESPVVGEYSDPRIMQLGIYDDTNLSIIPLGHHAHSWQDMRPFTNPANPTLKGTKGLHYPLAKLLLAYLPDDYKVLVVSSTYGGTGYTTGATGTYDGTAMKPSAGALKWGLTSPYYLAFKDRIKFALNLHNANAFIGAVYIQGENDKDNPNGWEQGYTALRTDFLNFINTDFADRKVKDDFWYFVESTSYWKAMQGYQTILQKAKAIDGKGYVAIPDNADTNATNGTGRTSSARASHYGNNVYEKVIAVEVLKAIGGGEVVVKTNKDEVYVYRRTQKFNFLDETNSFAWSGNQIQYQIPVPVELQGKFCEVFINGNVDSRVPNMPSTLTLFSQDPINGDEILIVGYNDSEHITDTLNAHGL